MLTLTQALASEGFAVTGRQAAGLYLKNVLDAKVSVREKSDGRGSEERLGPSVATAKDYGLVRYGCSHSRTNQTRGKGHLDNTTQPLTSTVGFANIAFTRSHCTAYGSPGGC